MKNSFLLFILMSLITLSASAQTVNDPVWLTVGQYEVYILNEGGGDAEISLLIDAPKEVLEKYTPQGTFPIATNTVLLRKKGEIILIDTGYGQQLFKNLEKLGITPEEVDCIFLTHMHGDHIGGMLRDDKIAFPNAKVFVSEKERIYWTEAGNAQVLKVLSTYGEKVTTFNPMAVGSETGDGIQPLAAYGHTPGHAMFLIQDSGEQLLIWGDLAHAMAVQMAHPKISVTYDVDPDMARESRQKVLKYVAEEGIPIAGMHIPTPGTGKVEKDGKGYVFLPGNQKKD